MTRLSLLASLALVAAACTGSSAETTTTTTQATTTTTTTSSTVATTTTTTEPPTTTTEQTTTTTTATTLATTTTTEGDGETTTTTSTTLAPPTSSSTTIATVDPDLEPWAGVFRQPTGYDGYMQLRADGVVRAGYDFADMPFEGTWDYDGSNDSIVFTDFDIEGDCDGATGRYSRDTAPGGGMTLTLIEDPCQERIDYITQPGSTCRCFTWLRVEEPE